MVKERLKAVAIFSGLEEDDLERICQGVEEQRLGAGEVLFREGDLGETAYVIDDGQLEILKATERHEKLVTVRHPGEVIGEMALLQETPRSATVRARTDTTLLAIPKARIDELIEVSPHAASVLYRVVLQRWRELEQSALQAARLSSLGRITATLTHELNNPAAAVRRASTELGEILVELERLRALLARGDLSPSQRETVVRLVEQAGEEGRVSLDALTRSEREELLEERMEELGVERPWELAPELVDAGIGEPDLDGFADELGEALPTVLRLLALTHAARSLLAELDEASGRISETVAAMKHQTRVDQAPVQNVDIRKGLEATLTLLRGKAKDIQVRTEIAEDLPLVEGYGGDLGDVWMNLIDNAVDAVHETGRSDGRIVVRAFEDEEGVVVEVEDNGAGISPDDQSKIFELFFTTKPQGVGSGVGLHSVYNIVVDEHGGVVDFTSEPGVGTTFHVRLPLRLPARHPDT